MPDLNIYLHIQPEEILSYYRGHVHSLRARTDEGFWIQLPLQPFRAFVTRDGLKGRFRIEFNSLNKLISITSL